MIYNTYTVSWAYNISFCIKFYHSSFSPRILQTTICTTTDSIWFVFFNTHIQHLVVHCFYFVLFFCSSSLFSLHSFSRTISSVWLLSQHIRRFFVNDDAFCTRKKTIFSFHFIEFYSMKNHRISIEDCNVFRVILLNACMYCYRYLNWKEQASEENQVKKIVYKPTNERINSLGFILNVLKSI